MCVCVCVCKSRQTGLRVDGLQREVDRLVPEMGARVKWQNKRKRSAAQGTRRSSRKCARKGTDKQAGDTEKHANTTTSSSEHDDTTTSSSEHDATTTTSSDDECDETDDDEEDTCNNGGKVDEGSAAADATRSTSAANEATPHNRQGHNASHTKGSAQLYEAGDVVFAKVPGYPYWPGMVIGRLCTPSLRRNVRLDLLYRHAIV